MGVDPEIAKQLAVLRFDYDPETGIMRWRRRPLNDFVSHQAWHRWNNMHAGKIAGSVNDDGYRHAKVIEHSYKLHRVAWLLFYGVWPEGDLDHINGDRTDNRIANLRIVNREDNGKNRRISSNNTSGQTGVCWHPKCKKWVASIRVSKHQIYLGRFDEFNRARQARKAAEQKYGFHTNHGSMPLPAAPLLQKEG